MTITLHDGTVLEGALVNENDRAYTIRPAGITGRTRYVFKTDIVSVDGEPLFHVKPAQVPLEVLHQLGILPERCIWCDSRRCNRECA